MALSSLASEAPWDTPGAWHLSYRSRLKEEQAYLERRECEQQETEDAVQRQLAEEMCELKNYCHEQGQTVGLLSERLAGAREAVTVELKAAFAIRNTLLSELLTEESIRQHLETSAHEEQAEVRTRLEASEKQVLMMRGVRASLEDQLRSSEAMQAKCQEEIEQEKEDRTALRWQFEEEMTAWNEHKERAHTELSDQMREVQLEHDSWSEGFRSEMAGLRDLELAQRDTERTLEEELSAAKQQEGHTLARYEAEKGVWNAEVGELRLQMMDRDMRFRQEDEQRTLIEQSCLEHVTECENFESEIRACELRMREDEAEVESSERKSKELRAELKHLQESLLTVRHDDELERLTMERKQADDQLQAAKFDQAEMEHEFRRSAFSIFGKKKKPASPASPTPVVPQPQAHSGPPAPPPPTTVAPVALPTMSSAAGAQPGAGVASLLTVDRTASGSGTDSDAGPMGRLDSLDVQHSPRPPAPPPRTDSQLTQVVERPAQSPAPPPPSDSQLTQVVSPALPVSSAAAPRAPQAVETDEL